MSRAASVRASRSGPREGGDRPFKPRPVLSRSGRGWRTSAQARSVIARAAAIVRSSRVPAASRAAAGRRGARDLVGGDAHHRRTVSRQASGDAEVGQPSARLRTACARRSSTFSPTAMTIPSRRPRDRPLRRHRRARLRGAVARRPFRLFVEEGAEARGLIRTNIEAMALGGRTRLFRRDATRLGAIGPTERFIAGLPRPALRQEPRRPRPRQPRRRRLADQGRALRGGGGHDAPLEAPAALTLADQRIMRERG